MKSFYNILFLLIVLLCFVSCEKEKTNIQNRKNIIVDDLDNEVAFDSIPNKIVSLAPNITEMLFELDCGDKIIGNTIYCNYPEDSKSIEKVADLLTINYEKLVSLKPDIVFLTVEGNTKESYDKLLSYGLKIFITNPRDYNGIKKTFRDLAKILDKKEVCEYKIALWDSLVFNINVDSNTQNKKTVMFLISLKPIMLAGKNTFVNEFITMCGMKNIAEESEQNYPLYSREEILDINPDYIIYPSDIENENDIQNMYPEWTNLKAFNNGNVIIIDPDLYFRPSPRFAEALVKLNKKFNKER